MARGRKNRLIKEFEEFMQKLKVDKKMQKQFTMKVKIKSNIKEIHVLPIYKKYKYRRCRIENMCGRFSELVNKHSMKHVIIPSRTCMGVQEDIYSIYGNGSFMSNNPNRLYFKGCRNLHYARLMASDMFISDKTKILVNMIVVSACIGQFVDVGSQGIMQEILDKQGFSPFFMHDMSNAVRFQIPNSKWPGICFPKNNDWTITMRGSLIARMTFDAIEWTSEIENDMIKVCNAYFDMFVQQIREV
jgi:hypothetical protein